MMTYKIIFAATLFVSAMAAGLFYSYSVSINPGLHRLSDEAYLQSMQHINRAILNPWFFASFMGTLFLLPICTWMVYRHEGVSTAFFLILIATLLYAIGTFGITIARNVPLNNMLDQFNIQAATPQEWQAKRAAFEIPWNRWHAVRTVAVALSLLCSICAGLFR